jgi:molybdenum cofactor cytidylyltransferase
MESSSVVSALFRDEPQRWGLRGDPHLWREMRRHLEGVECPSTPEALTSIIEQAFEELTGFPLSHADPFYVEKYSHGGMSSGYVNPKFWRETAVPLLHGRLPARRSEDAE